MYVDDVVVDVDDDDVVVVNDVVVDDVDDDDSIVVISEGVESFQQLRDDITENNAYHIMILDLRGMEYWIEAIGILTSY